MVCGIQFAERISIHALREESDCPMSVSFDASFDFNPRSP